jgi:hypothetical protein
MPFELTAKKRIDIMLEAPLLNRALDKLERLPVSGYSVFPLLAGKGRYGTWRREGLVSDAGQAVMICCIVSQNHVDDVLNGFATMVERHSGFISIQDAMAGPARYSQDEINSPRP